jgi:hypothetical protein
MTDGDDREGDPENRPIEVIAFRAKRDDEMIRFIFQLKG